MIGSQGEDGFGSRRLPQSRGLITSPQLMLVALCDNAGRALVRSALAMRSTAAKHHLVRAEQTHVRRTHALHAISLFGAISELVRTGEMKIVH